MIFTEHPFEASKFTLTPLVHFDFLGLQLGTTLGERSWIISGQLYLNGHDYYVPVHFCYKKKKKSSTFVTELQSSMKVAVILHWYFTWAKCIVFGYSACGIHYFLWLQKCLKRSRFHPNLTFPHLTWPMSNCSESAKMKYEYIEKITRSKGESKFYCKQTCYKGWRCRCCCCCCCRCRRSPAWWSAFEHQI